MAVVQHPTTITVPLAAQPYPIVLGAGSLASLAQLLIAQGIRADTRVLLVTNPEVERHYGAPCRRSLEEAGFPVHTLVIESGENQKTPSTVALIHDAA